MRIRYEGIDNFSECESLEELDLSGNTLDDWSCQKLGRVFRNSNLRSLNLSNNPLITNRGVESLHWIRSLRTLTITGTAAAKYPFLELLSTVNERRAHTHTHRLSTHVVITSDPFICPLDPFADAIKSDDSGVQDGLIHIRIQQRNGRKTLTTVQGISDNYDKKKIVKACKKEFACNGTVVEHPEYGEVIQLQGDQRNNICQFLTKVQIAKPEQLKVHGF
ncbi:unnamed protein product [Medioppia subpectinata]|uniref:Eukaryotic translation initiation factor eIF1 n=1 Tax=Medioppia subpectinata TaxID=1979941 RepID=A0A7R9L011_9ACAR|nr:unnamed protein product [Medioppia subpectinata]CAG2111774.1 unnamed protein product [Medioppia subpectinata]